jgi:hypothetical protein
MLGKSLCFRVTLGTCVTVLLVPQGHQSPWICKILRELLALTQLQLRNNAGYKSVFRVT